MAPAKTTAARAVTSQAAKNSLVPIARKGLTQRSTVIQNQNVEIVQARNKRKAEHSPIKNEKVKRSAFGNLTNNAKVVTQNLEEQDMKQLKKVTVQSILDEKKIKNNATATAAAASIKTEENLLRNRVLTRAAASRLVTLKSIQGDDKKKANLNDDKKSKATKFFVYREEDEVKTKNEKNDEIIKTKETNQIEIIQIALDRFDLNTSKQNAISNNNRTTEISNTKAASTAAVTAASKACGKLVRRISNEFNKTEESLYMSALEDVSGNESSRYSSNFEAAQRRSLHKIEKKEDIPEACVEIEIGNNYNKVLPIDPVPVGVVDFDKENLNDPCQASHYAMEIFKYNKGLPIDPVPVGVADFDKENLNDPCQASHYAMEIFYYLKQRESDFVIDDYMARQPNISKYMRTLLVDWMVEVQETFELNHETLYLAVKIVDLYLVHAIIGKEKLQLLGAAALVIAAKYDERTPPLLQDFIYICDGAYTRDDLVRMEIETLGTIEYGLGIPISYRFLRRYARCAKVPMVTLTLARYILELSLMNYKAISKSDSKLAAASLFLALRMYNIHADWTPTLKYYSGYELKDFTEEVVILNEGLHIKPKGPIKTVQSKYSHRIFFEVAKVPLLSTEEVFAIDFDQSSSKND